ncbi:MAG: transcriptional repressor [Nitrospirae bacterium]|nr:MAG: transcriptional repressor [Nitrospirota bacterium]
MYDTITVSRQLKAAGVHPTAQRIAIYHYLLSQAKHPTVEDIKAWVDQNFPKMSLATVYNTLRTFVEAKLVKELKLPHSSKTVYDTNVRNHHHFFDEDSGELIDLDPAVVTLDPALKRKYLITHIHVLLRGTQRRKYDDHA